MKAHWKGICQETILTIEPGRTAPDPSIRIPAKKLPRVGWRASPRTSPTKAALARISVEEIGVKVAAASAETTEPQTETTFPTTRELRCSWGLSKPVIACPSSLESARPPMRTIDA